MARPREQKVLHANTAIVKFEGQEIAFMQNVSVNNDSGADYVYEIGSINPIEINHNRLSHRIQASALHLRGGAGHRVANRMATLADIAPFDIEFIDRDNGTAWVASGAEPVSDSVNVPLNQRVTHQVTFMALLVRPAGATIAGDGAGSGPIVTSGGGGGAEQLTP